MSFLGGLISSVAGPLIGGLLGSDSQERANDQNAALQREFAQQGIRWKVEDAKAAGINPLFALGAPAVSFQPSYVGDTALPSALANIGQNISSRIDSTRTAEERVDAASRALLMERGALENDLLRSQIALTNSQVTPPSPGSSYLVDGQTQSGVIMRPSDLRMSRAGNAGIEAAPPSPSTKEFRHSDGTVSLYPSKDIAESIEDNFVYQVEHFLRNRILPAVRENVIDRPYRYGQAYGRGLKRIFRGRR